MAEDLAVALKSWAVQEMKYSGPFPDMEKNGALVSGSLQEIWKHLIHNCRSPESVAMIKGNLQLSKKRTKASLEKSSLQLSLSSTLNTTSVLLQQSGDPAVHRELLAEHARLSGRLHNARAHKEQLRLAVKEAVAERRETERARATKERQLQALRQKTALLKMYGREILLQTRNVSTVTEDKLKPIDQELKDKMNTAKNEKLFSTGTSCETPTEKTVKDCVSKAARYLSEQLSHSNTNGNQSNQQIAQEISRMLRTKTGTCLQNGIINNIQHELERIKQQRTSLNLQKEIRELQLQTDANSYSSQIVSSVQKEIGEFYRRHVETYRALQNAKVKLAHHERYLDSLVKDKGTQKFSSSDELTSRLATAKRDGVVSFLKEEIERRNQDLRQLETENSEKKIFVQKVHQDSDKIQETLKFIVALAVNNNKYYSHLYDLQVKNLKLTDELPILNDRLHKATATCIELPIKLLNSFMKVPVSRLCSTVVILDKEANLIPTPDLAIYRLRSNLPLPVNTQNIHDKQDICNWVIQLIRQVGRLTSTISKSRNNTAEYTVNKEPLFKLINSLDRNRQQQLKDILPMINVAENKKNQGLTLCKTVEDALSTWREQPASTALADDTSLLVEGETLGQWQERVSMLVAKLNSKG